VAQQPSYASPLQTLMQPPLVQQLVASGAVPAHFAVNDWELVYVHSDAHSACSADVPPQLR
jgi:hypothetical protein